MRLLNYYKYSVAPEFIWKQDVNSVNQIPLFNKMVLSSTSKLAIRDKKWYLPEISALELVSGQKGKKLVQKTSIAAFQIREGQLFGCKFTLRKQIMYLFLDRFIVTILPQLSDFKSISAFDKKDGINIGLNRLFFFNELEQNYQFFEQISGLNVALVSVGSTFSDTKHKQTGRVFLENHAKQSSSLVDNLKPKNFSLNNTVQVFPDQWAKQQIYLFLILKKTKKDFLLLSSFQWPNK